MSKQSAGSAPSFAPHRATRAIRAVGGKTTFPRVAAYVALVEHGDRLSLPEIQRLVADNSLVLSAATMRRGLGWLETQGLVTSRVGKLGLIYSLARGKTDRP